MANTSKTYTLNYRHLDGTTIQWDNQTVAQLLQFWADAREALKLSDHTPTQWLSREIMTTIEKALNG